MHGWCWKNWFISSLHFTLKSYLRDIENGSLLKFLLALLCLFPALFTMISTKNSIALANIGHGAGAGIGKVITQPITGAMPEPNGKVQLLRASCKLEEISDHLISQALDPSRWGERLVWQCHLVLLQTAVEGEGDTKHGAHIQDDSWHHCEKEFYPCHPGPYPRAGTKGGQPCWLGWTVPLRSG